MWDTTRPHAICGFAVDRAAAEALLAEQPAGTFLVRTCSEAGAFAISCCMGGPGGHPFVDHLLVDAVDLATRCLEAWVHAHQHAAQLLDPLSDKLFPKVRTPPRAPGCGRGIAAQGGRMRRALGHRVLLPEPPSPADGDLHGRGWLARVPELSGYGMGLSATLWERTAGTLQGWPTTASVVLV